MCGTQEIQRRRTYSDGQCVVVDATCSRPIPVADIDFPAAGCRPGQWRNQWDASRGSGRDDPFTRTGDCARFAHTLQEGYHIYKYWSDSIGPESV